MMACALDDVFDEDSDTDIASSEWERLRQSRIKDGYRDGFEAGQGTTLQAGFNKGYCEGVKSAYQINHMKGLLSALKAYHEQTEHHIFSASDKEAISEMIQELETLEQSQHAMLQSLTAENTAAEAATSQPFEGNVGADVNAISMELNQMHILQDGGADTMAPSQVTGVPSGTCGMGDDDSGATSTVYQDGATVQRLRDISKRCRSLFSQLDIQNLLQ